MFSTGDRTITPETFRGVFGHFASGVVVIAGHGPKGPAGLAVQSFSALSQEPPMVMFAVDRSSRSWPDVAAAQHFAVSILAEDQQHVARAFSRSGTDKFATVSWSRGPVTSAPVIDDALAWAECEVAEVHSGGDHVIVTAHALALHLCPQAAPSPLVFYRSGFPRLTDPH
jgi:3-hydroxy-9,10-secoandrosta-1,3,5(10)-triene-9,17-dione monooxygenase reductase component